MPDEQHIELWMGSDSSHTRYITALEKAESATAEDIKALAGQCDEDEPEFESPLLSRDGRLGVIQISGEMTNKASPFLRYFGLTPYAMIYDAYLEAALDDSLEEIVTVWNSPGGTVSGISQAMEGLNEAKTIKPVHAYVTEDMNSAAYWIGSASTSITADEMASVGSIGVVAVVQNHSERLKKEGIDVKVFRAGAEKALVNPYEKMTPAAEAELQAKIDRSHTRFINGVAGNLGVAPDYVREKMATGKVFDTEEALQLGMIDKVMAYNDFFRDKVVKPSDSQQKSQYGSLINGGIAASSELSEEPVADSQLDNTGTNMAKTKKVITAQAQAAAVEGVTLPEDKASEALADETVTSDEANLDEKATEGTVADATTEEAPKEEASTEVEQPSQAQSFIDLADKYATKVEALATATAELTQLKAESSANVAMIDRFKAITADSINRMQIILGGQAQDLEKITAGNLLDMHTSTYASVIKKLPVGQHVQQETGEAVDEAVSSINEQFAHLTSRTKK